MFRAIALILLLSSAALAQTNVTQEPDRVVYQQHQKLDLTGADIDGEVKAPAAALIVPKRPSVFANLIRVRGDFAAELRTSVDAL